MLRAWFFHGAYVHVPIGIRVCATIIEDVQEATQKFGGMYQQAVRSIIQHGGEVSPQSALFSVHYSCAFLSASVWMDPVYGGTLDAVRARCRRGVRAARTLKRGGFQAAIGFKLLGHRTTCLALNTNWNYYRANGGVVLCFSQMRALCGAITPLCSRDPAAVLCMHEDKIS